MLRSLRTRLALLFAGMLLIAAVIAAAASIRLYQSYNRTQTARELRGQVAGVVQYYASAAAQTGPRAPKPGHHGTDRDFSNHRNFLIREIFEFAQKQSFLEPDRKALDRGVHDLPIDLRQHEFLRIGGGALRCLARGRRALDLILILFIIVQRDGVLRALLLEPGERGIAHDLE